MIVLRNCHLIPELTEGYSGEEADVVIDDGVITSIEPCGVLADHTAEYDLKGKTLMPGMYDLHTHIQYTGHGDMHDGGRDEYQITLDAIKHSQACLMAGFTSLRDSGGIPNLNAHVKEYFEEGWVTGPNLSVCGMLMSPTEPGNKVNLWASRTVHEVDTAETIRLGVREEVRNGAEYIKYVASGSISMKGSDPKRPISTFEEIKTLVDEAAFKGCYVGAHCHDNNSIIRCLKAGVYTIEHASVLDDECVELLKEKDAYIIPTLLGASMIRDAKKSMPAYAAYFGRSAADEIRAASFVSYQRGYDEGLLMGLGTDMGMPGQFHGDNAKELIYRKKYSDVPAVEILKEATINSAVIMKEQDKRGTVQAGKIADLIVVDGDPVEDISCMYGKIHMVLKSGKAVKNGEEKLC